MSQKKKLTTNAGAPVVDNQNIMTAGTRGPELGYTVTSRISLVSCTNPSMKGKESRDE